MKRIKTYLRTTMSDERLSDLAILSIEKEISSKLVIDDIIAKFASMEPNRKILLRTIIELNQICILKQNGMPSEIRENNIVRI